jgi:hypothetical protein
MTATKPCLGYKHHSRCAQSLRPSDACDMPKDCAMLNPNMEPPPQDQDGTLWAVSHRTGRILVLAHHPVSWHNVKNWSYRIFNSDEVGITQSFEGPADFELRWVGHDAGRRAYRGMQVKKKGTDWTDA